MLSKKEDLKTQNDTQKKDIEKADKSKTDNVGTKYDLHISKTNFDKRFTEIVGKNTNKNSVYTERPLLSLYKNIEDNKGNKVYTYWVLDNCEFLMEQTVDKNDNLIGIKLVIQDLRFVDKDVYENFIGWTIQTVNPNMGWFKKKKIMFVLSPLSEGKHGCTEDGIIYAAICGNTKGAAIGLNKAMFIMVNENIKDYQ